MAAAKVMKKVNLLDSDEEFSDDENTPLTGQPAEEIKPWDPFRTMPPEDLSGSLASKKTVEAFSSIAKVIAYIFTFAILLLAGVVSKGTLLFMTSQIKLNTNGACDVQHEYCNARGGRALEANINMDERVAWVWSLFFCFAIPEVFMWFRSTRIVLFRTWKTPPTVEFLLIALMETVHVLGLAMLIYIVLPNLKVVEAVMLMHCVCVVPGILNALSRSVNIEKRFWIMGADIFAILSQFSGLFVWAGLQWGNGQYELVWVLPVSLFLVSFGWWENYVDKSSPLGAIRYLASVKENLRVTRYFTYIFMSIWKIIAFFVFMLAIEFILVGNVNHLFSLFNTSFGAHYVNVTEIKLPGDEAVSTKSLIAGTSRQVVQTEAVYAPPSTASYVLAIQAGTSLICFLAGKFACKIRIQGFSFALPINLVVPTTIALLVTFCGLKMGNSCMFTEAIPAHLFFNCPEGGYVVDVLTYQCAWLWLLWLLSQAWITGHIWTPKCGRLAATEKLFVHPFYNALLIEQSMAMNRRRDDEKDIMTGDIKLDKEDLADVEINNQYGYNTQSISSHSDSQHDGEDNRVNPADSITRIYTCATMWHETRDEIITFLKSIMYLDEDQSARRVAQKYLKIVDPDYYEIETHIFFDDAFELSDDDEEDMVINSFVKLLVESMDEAASYVHQTNVRIAPPKKIPTPYGGRLVWTLPGKTKIICHLKDKQKIRNRKRWSQVMYMYYLLGHKLMELPVSIDRKAAIAQNTYLLALDGDIDFVPDAVQLLIDLMKRNPNLGAACGRIHPVGSGLMAWYQRFEYAIGHWLQKATEHMIGCVLCSPGCFSLFRGKALMDDNVMAKYTTKSCEARHYVQYDQGEDRWLCTLLLQRGYRVEYCAASDAYTHCPEGFDEFYNQRRRWVPSTMANIMDLLGDYKRTIKVNDNISFLYICYHILLLVGTILGPGTIFLMIVGSFNVAFHIDNWTSFWINLVPIVGFIIVCMTTKAKFQVMIAQLLSTFYAIVMMAVLVGIILQLTQDGIASPSGIFLVMTALSFIIAAILHPQEFWCLPTGVIYYLTVPSMYLLLIIYSVCNLNNVSWGTREAPVKKKRNQTNEATVAAAAAAQKKNKGNALLSFFQLSGDQHDDEGSIEFSFAGLFKLMCCVHRKPDSAEKLQLMAISDSLTALGKRLDSIEKCVNPAARSSGRNSSGSRRSFSRSSVRSGISPVAALTPLDPTLNAVVENAVDDDGDSLYSDETASESEIAAIKEERNNLINPYWIEHKDMSRGPVDFLTGVEIQFWKDMIQKYLYPIDEDKAEQAKIAAALKELRNTSVFTFFILNALYVTVVFLLTLEKDTVHLRWPLGVTHNITYAHAGMSTPAVYIESQYLQLEPIGMVFVAFFASIMVIQFIAMLFHRFGTFSQILASTDIKICNKKLEEISQDAYIEKHAVQIARGLQQLKGFNDDAFEDLGPNEPVGRRKTIHNLERQQSKKVQGYTTNLQSAFRARLNSISPESDLNDAAFKGMRRETLQLLGAGGRRSTLVNELRRRSSVGHNAFEAQRAAHRRSTLEPNHEDSENSD